MRILFVENHVIFARTVCEAFLAGHVIEIVPDVATARQRVHDVAFDVLLVDHDLADGKGAELVAHLRARGVATPVVAVSAHAAGNQALLAAGADAACPKTRFDAIAEVLARLPARRHP